MYRSEELLAKAMSHLSRDELPAILRIQQQMVLAAHQFMLDAGVTHVFPVMLTPLHGTGSTLPGDTRLIDGRIVPEDIAYGDLKLRLMKSKSRIVRKQLVEAVEHADSGKHLYEFSMIDYEFRDVGCEYVMGFSERLISHIFQELNSHCSEQLGMFRTGALPQLGQLPRFFEEDLMEEYGETYEDTMSQNMETPFWLFRQIFATETRLYQTCDFPEKGRYVTFDLVWPYGFGEALSGAETEYDYDRLITRIEEKHTSVDEFDWYLELAARKVLPKTSGAGIGLERLTRFVTNKPHIEDVTVFLRKPHARSLF
jgi:asparaginyl-tRNA synthetase